MDFVRRHDAAGKGQLHKGGLITTDSSNTFMEQSFAGFEWRTGNVIGADIRHRVYHVSICFTDIESPGYDRIIWSSPNQKGLFNHRSWEPYQASTTSILSSISIFLANIWASQFNEANIIKDASWIWRWREDTFPKGRWMFRTRGSCQFELQR